MGEPVVLLGEGFVDAVIEVLVVGEDDMATDIVQLVESRSACSFDRRCRGMWRTYEALGRGVGAGKTAGLIGRVDNQPRRPILWRLSVVRAAFVEAGGEH